MNRLAIITTHPIQYHAPLFKLLQQRGRIQIRVFYTWGNSVQQNKYDPGFGKNISWDIPLLDGYDYIFEKNVSEDPGSHHYKGIDNPELVAHIKEWEANSILVFGWNFKSHLKCLRHFHKKIPVLFRGDSTLLNEKPGLKKMLRRIFLKWVYSHVNIAFYAGSQNKLYFMKHGLKKDQLLFAPHAIDNERFFGHDGEYEKKAMAWRRELNIRDEDLVFLFAGKLEPVKNIELLIQSFLNIQSEPANAIGLQLIIVGNGILEKSLKEKYEKLQNIHFIGFQNQSQMPVVYRLGNVFVLPSKSETWGLSVNEAMACGRAILVSDKCGSAIDLVNENGFIFKSGNVDDLRLKMKWMAEMKAGIPKMGLNSENMIQDWNFEKLACVIEDKIMDPIH